MACSLLRSNLKLAKFPSLISFDALSDDLVSLVSSWSDGMGGLTMTIIIPSPKSRPAPQVCCPYVLRDVNKSFHSDSRF